MDRQTRRKLIKTAVEKRRRERINNCLEQIRKLVLTAAGQRPDEQETMEKAEILELAVQHLTGYVKRLSKDMEGKNQTIHFLTSQFPKNDLSGI